MTKTEIVFDHQPMVKLGEMPALGVFAHPEVGDYWMCTTSFRRVDGICRWDCVKLTGAGSLGTIREFRADNMVVPVSATIRIHKDGAP